MKPFLSAIRRRLARCRPLLAAGMALCACSASAQFRNDALSFTNTIPATSTNSSLTGNVIDASRVSDFSLQIAFKLGGAGTTATVWKVENSVDGVNWASAFNASITPAGTTAVTWLTNVNCRAIPLWRVGTVENPNASAITNILVTPGLKRNRD